jgi:hypothetical protein
MIHSAEKGAMSASATVLAYLGRAQSEELPHTFPTIVLVESAAPKFLFHSRNCLLQEFFDCIKGTCRKRL